MACVNNRSVPASVGEGEVVVMATATAEDRSPQRAQAIVIVPPTSHASTTIAAVTDDAQPEETQPNLENQLIDANTVEGGSIDVGVGSSDDGAEAETTPKNKPAVTPITAAAKSALRAYFIKADWPRNQLLPKGNDFPKSDVGVIANEFQLVRDQVVRQLANYKKERFDHTQVTVIMNPSDLGQRMRESLSMNATEFISQTLKRICDPKPEYGTEFNSHSSAINMLPPVVHTFLSLLADSPENSCSILLSNLVEYWTDEMAMRFPKTAAGIPNAQLEFEKSKERNMHTFIDNFVNEYDSSGLLEKDIPKLMFGHLGGFLHVSIFMAWSNLVSNYEKPPVQFPTDCLVGKYAKPVIYYVAGWTIFRASKALTIARAKRSIYFDFASAHSVNESAAKNAGLPTSLVDKRKRKSSVYCTQQYYEFICFVESIFLANLTLDMMLAYNNGDIISKIKLSILSNSSACERFAALFDSDVPNEETQQSVMEYILDRYANMRGTYFVRHLKMNSGNQIEKLASGQATRAKVANAVVCTKLVKDLCGRDMDSMPECRALWESAEDCVFELADKEEEESDDNN